MSIIDRPATLNVNEFIPATVNAYTLMKIDADNLEGLDNSLVSRFKRDGNEYSDQQVVTSSDIGYLRRTDHEDANVFANEFVPPVHQQVITINQFRQAGIELEKYLTKRAWQKEGVFSELYGLLSSQLQKARDVYEYTLVATSLGKTITKVGKQFREIDLNTATAGLTGDEKNRVEAQSIMTDMANLIVDLQKPSVSYNDYGERQSVSKGRLRLIMRASDYNKILYTDLTTMFHNEALKAMIDDALVLSDDYFGADVAEATTADGATHRASDIYLIRVNASGAYAASGTNVKIVYPGDLLPTGTPIVAPDTEETVATYAGAKVGARTVDVTVFSTVHAYVDDGKVIYKMTTDEGFVYLASFSVNTDWFSPKNLRNKNWLQFAFAMPTYIKSQPFITVARK